MDVQTKKYLFIFLGLALAAYSWYAFPRSTILLILPISVFAFLHYLTLQKMLNVQFPLQPFSSKLVKWRKGDFTNLANYERHIDDANVFYIILFSAVIILAGITGASGFLLLYILTATMLLLVFSRFFLAKPIKETWKAILLAGAIAGACSYTLSYGLEKFVGPYLPVRTSKVQPVAE